MRPGRHYRRDAFTRALERLGYTVSDRYVLDPQPGDLLLSWNRSRNVADAAENYERCGADVLITENGYLPGPAGEKHFALARGNHNGSGLWEIGIDPRFHVELKPWREQGDHVLLLPQRGIGAKGVAMPIGWHTRALERLAKMTKRPIRLRRHPGLMMRFRALDDDLRDAHACVTWGSGAAIKAIVQGIPVFYALNGWIGSPAALPFHNLSDIERPAMPDRTDMLRWITWAQWSGEEIETGEPIARLLACK